MPELHAQHCRVVSSPVAPLCPPKAVQLPCGDTSWLQWHLCFAFRDHLFTAPRPLQSISAVSVTAERRDMKSNLEVGRTGDKSRATLLTISLASIEIISIQ